MKYRKLGNTGIEVSEIGFGTWGLGGNSYGTVDDNVSKAALRFAFDSGITFYDTSDLYGNGHSEEVLGDALHDVRDKIIISTKVGLLPHTGFDMPCDFSPAYIRQGLDASLRRLRSDYIDIYLLHSPTIGMLREDSAIVATLQDLKEAGKIRAYGISARSPDDCLASIQEFDFKIVQVNFNMIDQRAIENGLFDLAFEKKIGVIARTPLCFGYLTGKLHGNEVFEGIDHRANWPVEQLQRWAKAPDLFSFLNQGRNRTPTQLALRFCLDHKSASTVIPGMMNCNEVRENILASSLEALNAEEVARVKLIYESNLFYDKTAKQGR
ncbi:MAG TPA: aldo/keto reductase [Candidatus Wunengus sp. YC60]|uniref:aldo/keto reductase n=1 Tax=Candidatus Wunengus sp. YC60 TaxID=3367697 RepID=UPI0040250952